MVFSNSDTRLKLKVLYLWFFISCHIGSALQLCRDKLEDVTKLCVPQFCRTNWKMSPNFVSLNFVGTNWKMSPNIESLHFIGTNWKMPPNFASLNFVGTNWKISPNFCVPQFCRDRLDYATNFQYDFVANCSAGIWVSMENRKNWKRQSFESPLGTSKKVTNGANYSKMDQVKFVEDSLNKFYLVHIWIICPKQSC